MGNFIFPVIGDEKDLPVFIHGIGVSSPEYHFKRDNGSPFDQVIYTSNGEGELIIGEKKFSVPKGWGFYLPAKLPHEYYAKGSNIWETKWVIYSGKSCADLMTSLGFEQGGVFKIGNYDVVDTMFMKLLRYAKSSAYFDGFQGSALLYSLLVSLNRQNALKYDDKDIVKLGKLEPIIEYLDSNYMKDISLAALAENAHLSPQYLCRLFKECLNIRPFEYLAKKRIQEAKIMLKEHQELTVAEIAEKVGYKDCSYFCAVFKRQETLSPTEFRTLHTANPHFITQRSR